MFEFNYFFIQFSTTLDLLFSTFFFEMSTIDSLLFLKKLFLLNDSFVNCDVGEWRFEALGVLDPLLNPKLELLLLKLFFEVWGWALNENSIGELTKSFGKFVSFVKFNVMFAIELEDEGAFELAKLDREIVFNNED